MFKNRSNRLATRSLVLVALCATLFSFTARIGVESFTIYLNDKLIIQQYLTRDATVKTFSLNPAHAGDILKINYSHCGKVGSNRSISLHDARENVLKTWRFADHSSAVMAIHVTDIPRTADSQKVFLRYSSAELPDSKLLASVIIGEEDKVSLR
jgi:hypothetical protein